MIDSWVHRARIPRWDLVPNYVGQIMPNVFVKKKLEYSQTF